VGRVIPGSTVRVVDPDTGKELGPNQSGVLQFAGPNVMQGYLNQPEKTAEVIKDGWYHTGDIGTIDEAGFITLTGRLNRFSKIGGEMVPHVKIEEHLRAIVKADFPEEENLEAALAVTSVPDEKKGEKLVVLHKPLPRPVEEILKKFDEENLPNLWRPSRDCFVEVESVPILGTGKLDLRGIKEAALAKLAPEEAENAK
jgi:acyl-[acyl-carrier-protein]-phospholipid O-acyltransferase/long-chain-fatty-acid--[acyl-carrier-protein] ligase